MRRTLFLAPLLPALALGLTACDLPTSWERGHPDAPTTSVASGPQGGPSAATRSGGDAGTLLAEAEPAELPEVEAGAPADPDEDAVALPHPFDGESDHLPLAEHALARGRVDEAVSEFRKAVYDTGSYESLLGLGRAARRAHRPELAVRAFAGAAAARDQAAEPLVLLARVALDEGRIADGLRAVDKALVRAPDRVDALNVRGRLEMAREQYDRAVQDFERAVRLDPDYVWAWNNLGYVHLLTGRPEAAVEALEVATRLDRAEAYMFNNLGLAYRKTGRLAQAVAAFDAALERRPGYVNARINLDRTRVLTLALEVPPPPTE